MKKSSKTRILLSNLFWGFALWLFGYILGIIFFFFVPRDLIGFFVLPPGAAFTLWVLLKKIQREQFACYIGLGIIWITMAVALDYFFIVWLFQSDGYYKPDVYMYYMLTFILPVAVGWYKFRKARQEIV